METYVTKGKHGSFIVLRGDFISDCLATYGEWAEKEVELFQKLVTPGGVVFEVGANIGTHTVPLAKAIGPSGKLFALEAQRIVAQILGGNVALNALDNVRVLCSIVSDRLGTSLLRETDFAQPNNQGAYGVPSHSVSENGERTAVLTLDALAAAYSLSRVDLLKIDVEGMEEAVLLGAAKLIQEKKPTLFFESNAWIKPEWHERGDALNKMLIGWGYDLYWYCGFGFNPNNFRQVKENRVGTFGDINILALPKGVAPPVALKTVQSVAEIFRGEISWVAS